jgi:capsular exopolysaccharide synthesis family protein
MSVEPIQLSLEAARLQRGAELPAELRGVGSLPAEKHTSADVRHPATRLPLDFARLREQRIVMPDDAGAPSLAYRMLRTQVLQRVRHFGVRAIGVVSAADGEGKTLTAANLALGIAAQSNQSVLLVDLDLRRPSLATLFGLRLEQGLDAWFAGVVSIGDICHGIEGIENLEIIPTLSPVRGSSEILASRRSQDMLMELKNAQRQGLVIFDLPPVLLTDDFLTIASILDGVVLVTSEGITKRDDVARTRELMGNVRLLGTVLNRASESEQRAY